MLYDQRRKRSHQSMGAVPRAPASSRPATTPLPPQLPPLVRAHAATSRFLDALPRHSRHEPVWGSHLRVRSVLMTTHGDQERVLVTSAEADSSRSPRSSFTAATDTVSTALVAVTTASDESAMVYSPSTPFELQQRADVRKLIRHAHRARKLLLDRLTIVNLRRNHRCELMEEIARLKKVLANLQDQVDTTTRNVATMDRLVQHLQTISSIFTDATQVPDATALPAVIPTESTTEAAPSTPDAEPTRSSSRSPSQSPRSSSPGATPAADDSRATCAVEEEKEESTIEEQEQRVKEQNRERRQKEEEEEKSNKEAQVKGVCSGGDDCCSSDGEAEEEKGREVSPVVRTSPRAASEAK